MCSYWRCSLSPTPGRCFLRGMLPPVWSVVVGRSCPTDLSGFDAAGMPGWSAARDLQPAPGMRRRNVQQAFIGEASPDTDQLAVADDGDDAVEFDLRGGRVMMTVPAATPDDRVLEHQG